ncbi:restriction endonuclease subunit S [uncultured Lamprocystis sp.]|uniref:restriction endonuclease subunit S n=1 Tax=uncultured Lamprocystis sp. TaxID=543132 RepID=UPI0025F3E841|nr:restriction endonuclease subunit S [uncultured Lamprocystis sp.]
MLADCFLIGSGSAPGRFRDDQASVPLIGANGSIGACTTSNFGPGYIVGRVGAAGAVTRVPARVWASDNTLTLKPKSHVDSDFAHFLLISAKPWELATVTAQPLVTQSNLGCLRVCLPSHSEQRAIACILDTLDTAIHETEAIIAKLKAVKQGLLRDLLARGIDANGELRRPQAEAPHLYKQSPLGFIPKGWEEITLGEIARRSGGLLQTGPFGSQLHAHEYTIEGIPVVMPQDMVGGELSVENIARITERKASALARHRVKPNDLLFSRRGDLSRCIAINDQHLGWVCGTGCLLARLPRSDVNGNWLAQVYQQPVTQSQVMGRAVGSTMANLNTSILAAISIGRPAVNEQDEIARRVASASLRIRAEEQALQKLRLEKAGLMDDLLTGRVRVTPLLESAES